MTIEPAAEFRPKTIGNTDVTLGALRKRVWKRLTPATAYDVGLTWEEQRDFLAMRRTPPPEKLHLLCKRLGLI